MPYGKRKAPFTYPCLSSLKSSVSTLLKMKLVVHICWEWAHEGRWAWELGNEVVDWFHKFPASHNHSTQLWRMVLGLAFENAHTENDTWRIPRSVSGNQMTKLPVMFGCRRRGVTSLPVRASLLKMVWLISQHQLPPPPFLSFPSPYSFSHYHCGWLSLNKRCLCARLWMPM